MAAKPSRADVNALPFKSRTQIREFSTLAVYKSMLEGAEGTAFWDNIKLEKLAGYRQTEFFSNLAENIENTYAITCYHNIRVFCRKDAVEFTPIKDPTGTEMIQLNINGNFKGYAEPLN